MNTDTNPPKPIQTKNRPFRQLQTPEKTPKIKIDPRADPKTNTDLDQCP